MTPEQYRQECLSRSRKEDIIPTVEQARMLLCTIGLAGESGEVNDSLKKHVWHGKPLDRDHMIEEVGDVLWYADRLLMLLDCSLEECMQANVDKLAARYPDGFKKLPNDFAEQMTKDAPPSATYEVTKVEPKPEEAWLQRERERMLEKL